MDRHMQDMHKMADHRVEHRHSIALGDSRLAEVVVGGMIRIRLELAGALVQDDVLDEEIDDAQLAEGK